jgi:hypothetical protein
MRSFINTLLRIKKDKVRCLQWMDLGLTIDNFQKQHVNVVDRCYMCKRNGKSVSNLLLHFEVACAILECFLQSIRAILGYT